MKKTISFVLAMLMVATVALVLSACGSGQPTLKVYNWGEYADMEAIAMFEKETGIKVKYDIFGSNEEMYAKVKSGAGDYDVLVPSDYMIERMRKADMLAELDWSAMPNTSGIMAHFKDNSYDPDCKYSVPYLWGTLGILYNKSIVTEEVDSWDILFNGKYSKNILMYDSSRDSIGVAMIQNGFDINSRDEGELEKAKQTLIDQKPDVLAYVLDDVKDKMIQGEAGLAVVYSGYVTDAIDQNPDLAYCIPKEGSNVWVDGMVIPATSKNKDLAQKFIDFMCRPDIALMNVRYVAYSTPIQGCLDLMDEEERNNPIAYPSEEELARCEYYHDLGDYNEKYDDAWLKIKSAQ